MYVDLNVFHIIDLGIDVLPHPDFASISKSEFKAYGPLAKFILKMQCFVQS